MGVNEIRDAISPIVERSGCEIVDIEERSEYGNKVITVYVDKVPKGISLDDCERLHYEIEPVMDELDPTGGKPYVLEISSPGWTVLSKRSATSNAITARKWKSGCTLP